MAYEQRYYEINGDVGSGGGAGDHLHFWGSDCRSDE